MWGNMPKIVACMRVYDSVETRVSKVCDHLSEELVEAVFYSFIKYRTQALKELPLDQGSPLEGPLNFKEMFENVKKELQDLSHKMGESLVAGMAKSFAENMPFQRARPAVALLENPQDTLMSFIPSRKTVLDLLLGEKFKATQVNRGALEILDEEEPPSQVAEEIKAIEEELAKINTDSHFAHDIQLYERCMWQSTALRKRIWLYVFHMVNFFWNGVEAEKSRTKEGIVKMCLWGAGAIFSGFELRKSPSFRSIFSFHCYTPERFGLTIMKIALVALFLFQFTFFTSFKDLDHYQSMDKVLEKLFTSVIGATVISICGLTLLQRGYAVRIGKRKLALAEHKAKLHELLAQRQALLKKD
jgi:hypothetical protein